MAREAEHKTPNLLDLEEDEIRAWLKEVCKTWQQPGVSIAILRRGCDPFVTGVGRCKVGTQRQVGARTLFAAASVSKTFASATLGILWQEGLVSFDDRVIDYLPDFRLSDDHVTNAMTIADLLSNRSGLSSSEGRHRRCATSRRDLMRRMAHQPFRHPFRKQFGYCSDTFTCAGLVVEAITGKAWEDYARETIWEPIGMARTGADHRAAKGDPDSAVPHLMMGGGPAPIDWAYEEVATPAGGVNTCAFDLSLWLAELLKAAKGKSSILSKRAFDRLIAPQVEEDGNFRDDEFASVIGNGDMGVQDPFYALGWYGHTFHEQRVYYHTGAIDGFRSIAGFLPDLNIGCAVLANADKAFLPRALFHRLVEEAAKAKVHHPFVPGFLDHSLRIHASKQEHAEPKSSPEGSICPIRLGELCGRYQDHSGFGEAVVRCDGERLMLVIGAATYRLEHISGSSFAGWRTAPYAPLKQFEARWFLDAQHKPIRFVTTQNAQFERIEG